MIYVRLNDSIINVTQRFGYDFICIIKHITYVTSYRRYTTSYDLSRVEQVLLFPLSDDMISVNLRI